MMLMTMNLITVLNAPYQRMSHGVPQWLYKERAELISSSPVDYHRISGCHTLSLLPFDLCSAVWAVRMFCFFRFVCVR